jgi:hypothetical protein
LGLEDLEDMIEVIKVDLHNKQEVARITKAKQLQEASYRFNDWD